MNALSKLPDALDAFKRAEKRLLRAVERAYPVGAIVEATIGNARVRGPVLSHGGPGYYAGYIVIENERTGKQRSFYAARRDLHDVAVLELPNPLPPKGTSK